METLLYLAKVNLYWVLFYLCYRLLLRNHTFFVWNRIYLLGSLFIAFILPLITFPESIRASSPAIYAVASLPVSISIPEPVYWLFDWANILSVILAIGSLYLFFRFVKSISDLLAFIGKGDCIDLDDFKLVLLLDNGVGSFSFFKWLVMNRADYEENFEPILRHESVHIRQMHSMDILFIELLKILFWFNPVLWFFKRSIQEVHEYLADEHAPDRDGYARFLVSYAFNAPAASLTNHFFNGPLLKSRIKMIYKSRNSEWLRSKYFIILPLMFIIVVMTAAKEKVVNSIEKQAPAVVSAITTGQNKAAEFKAIALSDSKPKVEKATLRYTKNTAKTQLADKPTNSETYISQITDSVPKNSTFVGYNFGTRSLSAKTQLDSFPRVGAALSIRRYNGPGSDPLIIIDGVKQDKHGSAGFKHLDSDQIESISVLKKQGDIKPYGADGADGVVIIKTKK
jgi:hypothetical protein